MEGGTFSDRTWTGHQTCQLQINLTSSFIEIVSSFEEFDRRVFHSSVSIYICNRVSQKNLKLCVPPIWFYTPSDAQLSPFLFGILKMYVDMDNLFISVMSS